MRPPSSWSAALMGWNNSQVLKSYLDDRGSPCRSTFFDSTSLKEK